MQQTITGGHLIGFSESALGEETFVSSNPESGSLHPWTFYEASQDEIDRAMELAASAFRPYRDQSPQIRAQFQRTIVQNLEASKDEIIRVYCLESGLPPGRAAGELGRTQGQLRSFADLLEEGSWQEIRIDTALPDRTPIPRPDIRKCLLPMGPVVVFGASNFPLAFSTAGGDTASALAAGCPVVVKGHPLHPATSELVGRCIIAAVRELELPEGTFSLVQGSSHEVGARLVQHPQTAAVGFTGSRNGGLALERLSQTREQPIPVFAEMGSVNPVLILPSALQSKAKWAEAYASSVTLGSGQFCTNPGLIIAEKGPALDSFREVLTRAISKIPSSCMLDERIATNYMEMRDVLLSQDGVKMEPIELDGGNGHEGVNQVPPTVAAVKGAHFLQSPILQQEVFGPFTLVVACENQEEMKTVVGSLEGQLTGSVLGSAEELEAAADLVAALRDRVGRLLFNGVPTGVEVCPSMHHGGPFPATTDSRFTAVGTDAIKRWVRPVAFQNCPQNLLPEPLKDPNPMGLLRWINGKSSRDPIA